MAEADMVIPGLDDRFGLCPGCHREGLIMPVRGSSGRNGNWFACEACRVRWRPEGITLFRGVAVMAPIFDFEHDGFWLANARWLVRVRRVVPVYLQDMPGAVGTGRPTAGGRRALPLIARWSLRGASAARMTA
jgi:hypothetical protein